MPIYQVSHPEIKEVRYKTPSHDTAVSQVVFNGVSVWCHEYKTYVKVSGENHLKNWSVNRKSTQEPTTTTGQLSSIGTGNFTIQGVTYTNLPYYQSFFKDEIYIDATAKDDEISDWNLPNMVIPSTSSKHYVSTPTLNIINNNPFSVSCSLSSNESDGGIFATFSIGANQTYSYTNTTWTDGQYYCTFKADRTKSKTSHWYKIQDNLYNNGTYSNPLVINQDRGLILTGSQSISEYARETMTKSSWSTVYKPVVFQSPIITRKGNTYNKTQFSVENPNPTYATFKYQPPGEKPAEIYQHIVDENSTVVIDSQMGEGSTLVGYLIPPVSESAYANTKELTLYSLNNAPSDYTITSTGAQVTITVPGNSYANTDQFEVRYGAKGDWENSKLITSTATCANGWQKSFTEPVGEIYFHYGQKGYETRFNRIHETIKRLTAPRVEVRSASGFPDIFNNSGETADLYYSTTNSYSGTCIKTALANGSSYYHSGLTNGTYYYYLKPLSNNKFFSSRTGWTYSDGTDVYISNAMLYIYNGSTNTYLGHFGSDTNPTAISVGTYPHDQHTNSCFNVYVGLSSGIPDSIEVRGYSGIVGGIYTSKYNNTQGSSSTYYFYIDPAGSTMVLKLVVKYKEQTLSQYIKVTGNTDGWPD